MKILTGTAISAAIAAAATKEDWLFALGVIVTILNLVIEYWKSRKPKGEK